jgi:glycosyltransferase involved in cell wall biosynthesis
MAGFDAIGVVYRRIPSPRSGPPSNAHRFLSEQWHTLRLKDAQTLLYPNYYLPPLRNHQLPTTVVVHDTLFKDVPGSAGHLKTAWLNFAFGTLLRRAHNIVFVSQFSRRKYLENFGIPVNAKLWVIPNPIDEVSFAFGPRTVAADKPRVITVSAYYPHKNFETFVRLANIFHRNARFTVVGRSPSLQQLKQLIARAPDIAGMLKHVEFTGYLTQAKLVELMRESAALVFPSRYEGFGMPPVEAGALGLPVVASDLPALRETLEGKVTFITRIDDLMCWAAGLESVLSSPPSWGQRAIWSEEILQKFNRSAIAEKYADVLRAR